MVSHSVPDPALYSFFMAYSFEAVMLLHVVTVHCSYLLKGIAEHCPLTQEIKLSLTTFYL